MRNFQAVPAVKSWLASLAPRVPELDGFGDGRSNHLAFRVRGVVGILEAEIGRPRDTWMSRTREERAEQITLTAPRSKLGRWGWGAQTRTFKPKADGSFNEGSIIKALGEMARSMIKAEETMRQQDKAEKEAVAARSRFRSEVAKALELPQLAFAGEIVIDTAFGQARIRTDSGGVSIGFPDLTLQQAAELLRLTRKTGGGE